MSPNPKKRKIPITEAIAHVVPKPVSRMAKKLGIKPAVMPPVHEDPRSELRRLVKEHARWTRTAAHWTQSVNDITRHDGTVIKCTVPESIRDDIKDGAAKALKLECTRLESAMRVELRKLPVYQLLLSKVWTSGVVTSAYLCAYVDIDKCRYVSNLIRYCGNAVDSKTGRAERRGGSPKAAHNEYPGGGTGTFNQTLKIAIYMGMKSMWRSNVRTRAVGKSNKYLDRWIDAKHTRITRGEPKGKADHAGRRKATDLLLWDVYLVWRTIEGLPVWPDKYTADRGFAHGGVRTENTGRVFTLEEALDLVGDVSAHPREFASNEETSDE